MSFIDVLDVLDDLFGDDFFGSFDDPRPPSEPPPWCGCPVPGLFDCSGGCQSLSASAASAS